jgi:hypothetical protein
MESSSCDETAYHRRKAVKALLNGQFVDASEIDPAKHVFSGMWRSPTMLVDEESEKRGYIVAGPSGISAFCPTCRGSYGAKLPHLHQQQGCWDIPSTRLRLPPGESRNGLLRPYSCVLRL